MNHLKSCIYLNFLKLNSQIVFQPSQWKLLCRTFLWHFSFQLYKMFLKFESVYEILRCGTFFSKNCYKVKYFCSLTSSRHLHGLTELNRWMMLIIMWLTTPRAGQNWTTSCIHPREVAKDIRLRFTDEILFVVAPGCFLELAHLPRSRKKNHINRVFQKFVPIVYCILGKAFNASLGKFTLIQVRNLSK